MLLFSAEIEGVAKFCADILLSANWNGLIGRSGSSGHRETRLDSKCIHKSHTWTPPVRWHRRWSHCFSGAKFPGEGAWSVLRSRGFTMPTTKLGRMERDNSRKTSSLVTRHYSLMLLRQGIFSRRHVVVGHRYERLVEYLVILLCRSRHQHQQQPTIKPHRWCAALRQSSNHSRSASFGMMYQMQTCLISFNLQHGLYSGIMNSSSLVLP